MPLGLSRLPVWKTAGHVPRGEPDPVPDRVARIRRARPRWRVPLLFLPGFALTVLLTVTIPFLVRWAMIDPA
ncbi:MAG: hypothetical protein Q9Q40_04035 [Acidobacteriota bacterium]|nr:hypothetical protein [Acidobacteriota bacterium]